MVSDVLSANLAKLVADEVFINVEDSSRKLLWLDSRCVWVIGEIEYSQHEAQQKLHVANVVDFFFNELKNLG